MRSLSNLYKQWYVRTENANTRVIDSDALMAEYLKKNNHPAVKKTNAAETGGFAEGIIAADANGVIKAEVDAAELAEKEAERILAKAREEAEKLLKQAGAEADGIRETAKNKGCRDGQKRLNQELTERQAQLEDDYQKKLTGLETSYRDKMINMEKELVDVILEVFNKVFHIQFDNKKHILMSLINDAILDIEGEKRFRIKVAESNVVFLENHKEDIMDRVGHDIELEILADSTMDGNDCTIETDSGVFECSIGVQLENLLKDIRSLCS